MSARASAWRSSGSCAAAWVEACPVGGWPWLAAAVASGGMAALVLLMIGLTRMPASSAALLLNAEGVFMALLAWFVFRENVDRRIAIGMAAIVAGGTNPCTVIALGATWLTLRGLAGALLIGWVAYGVSLALFVVARATSAWRERARTFGRADLRCRTGDSAAR